MHLARTCRQIRTPWYGAAVLLALAVCLPLLVLVGYLATGTGDTWPHVAEYLLPRYVGSTLVLCAGIAATTLLLGVPTAWLVTFYEFPGRRQLSWGLMLPLAIPTYLAAYTWAGIFDLTGPVYSLLGRLLAPLSVAVPAIPIMSIPGAILVMSSVLFPYVYLLTRNGFSRQSRQLVELARSQGRTPGECFRQVGLPLARPAMVAGVSLALMETLNDYGAVKYYGIDTFTTGIFHAWFGLDDVHSAVRISLCLLLVVFLLLGLERWQRGGARYAEPEHGAAKPVRRRLRGWRAAVASTTCALPVTLCFAVPSLMLVIWTSRTWRQVVGPEFLALVRNSVVLATGTALLGLLIALVLCYAVRLHGGRVLGGLTRLASIGYVVPGAVLAIGMMMLALFLDRQLFDRFNDQAGLVLTGSLAALIAAYVVRFLALGSQTLSAGFERIGQNVHEASRTLGAGPTATLWQVELPLLRGPLAAAAILLFVEVLKELPLTLILRPFNFETLATKAYEYAGEEMIAESASGSLLIIVAGLVPILVLNRILQREEATDS